MSYICMPGGWVTSYYTGHRSSDRPNDGNECDEQMYAIGYFHSGGLAIFMLASAARWARMLASYQGTVEM